jgi:signal transduction histidine kinase
MLQTMANPEVVQAALINLEGKVLSGLQRENGKPKLVFNLPPEVLSPHILTQALVQTVDELHITTWTKIDVGTGLGWVKLTTLVALDQDELASLRQQTLWLSIASLLSGAVILGLFLWRAYFSLVKREHVIADQLDDVSTRLHQSEKLASLGQLAAGVAHEINNPLASIAWSAEALESRLHRILHPVDSDTHAESGPDVNREVVPGVDLDTLRTYLRRIQDEAFRCKGITERLLDFSRLGTEQRKQSIDMNEIVQDVVDMVGHLGQFRNRRIEFQPRPMPMIAWASAQEMKQVVLNLLTNSLESLDPERSDGCVKITIEALSDSVRMVIEDNGIGMSEEVLKHLFEPFFTRRRDGRGTGLGLPITSRIIADHGGRITPKSQGLNCGSRFEVILPNQPAITQTQNNDSIHEKNAA